jgi:hypothetical protein
MQIKTPLELTMAVHYASHANDYGLHMVNNYDAPAVQETRLAFREAGLLRVTPAGNAADAFYSKTPLLDAYLALLLQTPIPEFRSFFVDPRNNKVVVDPDDYENRTKRMRGLRSETPQRLH